MGLDEWELLDRLEDEDEKLCSAKRGGDQRRDFDLRETDRSISVPDEQHTIIGGAPRENEETGVQGDEDAVLQVSGQKMKDEELAAMKKECSRFGSEGIAAPSDVWRSSELEEEVEGKEGVDSRIIEMAMEKSGVGDWRESKGGLYVQKWGRAAGMCWFGIAVAATVCTLLLGSRRHDDQQHGWSKKQHGKKQICPCE